MKAGSNQKANKDLALLKRRERVGDLILQGASQQQVATIVGVSYQTIIKDRKWLEKKWGADGEIKHKQKRQRAIARQLKAGFAAWDSYIRSRQDATETTTTFTEKRCPKCKGSGKYAEATCEPCEGVGLVTKELVTTKVKGQAGDSSFLRLYHDCMKEVAKLQNLYPEVKRVEKTTEKKSLTVIQVQSTVDWARLPPDAILEGKNLLARLSQAATENDLELKSEAIEVEVEVVGADEEKSDESEE